MRGGREDGRGRVGVPVMRAREQDIIGFRPSERKSKGRVSPLLPLEVGEIMVQGSWRTVKRSGRQARICSTMSEVRAR